MQGFSPGKLSAHDTNEWFTFRSHGSLQGGHICQELKETIFQTVSVQGEVIENLQ